MDFSAIADSMFVSGAQQQARMESLANGALSSGMNLYASRNYEGAVREFKRSIALSPASSFAVDAAKYMAQASLQLKDTAGAIKAYKTGLQLDPYNDDLHISLGNLYFTDNRYGDAEKSYRDAVRLNPSANNLYALGQTLLNTGKFGEAESLFHTIQRMEPAKPNGTYGLGLTFSKQERYAEAEEQFKKAIGLQKDFYSAYADLGYAYADMGRMEEAYAQYDFLLGKDAELAETLGVYIHEKDPPRLMFAHVSSTFRYYSTFKTPVSALDAYLANADASKSFTMKFQFDKTMDRASVENPFNWQISRAADTGAAKSYNFGLPLPSTEVRLPPFPVSALYDAEANTATISFTIQQNATADGTLDPSHILFKFKGKDVNGVPMDPDGDAFSGYSGVV